MAFKIGDLFESPTGIAVGIGSAVAAPFVIPAAAKAGKPIAKSALKGGLIAYERSKGWFAEASESFEDVMAEAKAELAENRANRAESAGSDGGSELGS